MRLPDAEFKNSIYDDYVVKVFKSKNVMRALFNVVKKFNALLDIPKIVEEPKQMEDFSSSLRVFTNSTSILYIDMYKTLFTSTTHKATLEFLASEEIQHNVLETAIALFKRATDQESTHNYSPELRMRLCWCAMNILSLQSMMFILPNKREAYLDNIVLKMIDYISQCFVTIMGYFSGLPDDKKADWKEIDLMNMPTWPAVLICCIQIQYQRDEEEDKTLGASAFSLDHLKKTVISEVLDAARVVTALERVCQIGAALPWLFKTSDSLGMSINITRAPMLINIFAMKLRSLLGAYEEKERELELLLPKVLDMSLAAIKKMNLLASMPTSTMIDAFKRTRVAPMEIADAPNLHMQSTLAGALCVNVLELITTSVNRVITTEFVCPPECGKKYVAVFLVLIYTLQRLPDIVISDMRLRSQLSMLLGRLWIPDTLAYVLLPSEASGLERLLTFAENEVSIFLRQLYANIVEGTDEFVQDQKIHAENIRKLLNAAKNASATDIERAVKRSKVLATLPCGYVGCTSFALPYVVKNNKKCSGCKIVRYCSPSCQKKDWKLHKIACKAVA